MDRDVISFLAHASHPVASPFDDDTVSEVLAALPVPDGGLVLDVGCGRGEWLLRLLSARPGVRGVGVDRAAPAIAAAGRRAAELGLAARVELVRADAGEWLEASPAADAAMCVGATHAFGGFAPTLDALRSAIGPGGHVLVGEGFWEREPTPAALAALDAAPGDFANLDGLLSAPPGHGFDLVEVTISRPAEWDRYERRWCAALERAADDLDDPDAADELRETARAHAAAYAEGYRGILGFAALLLAARS